MVSFYKAEFSEALKADSSEFILRESSKCILIHKINKKSYQYVSTNSISHFLKIIL
jgi:hypothetical protein